MRYLAISGLVCFALGVLVFFLSRMFGPAPLAIWFALTPAVLFVPIHQALDRYVGYRSSELAYLKSYDMEAHLYSWWLLAPCALITFLAVSTIVGFISGTIARTVLGQGYAAELYIGPFTNILAQVLVTVTTVWIGQWIGARTKRGGIWVALFVVTVGCLILKISELEQLDDATFRLMHSGIGKDRHYFILSMAWNLPLIGIPIIVGYAIGRSRRNISYVGRLLALTPASARRGVVLGAHNLAIEVAEMPRR
jgi:hypothetical protein